MYPIFRHTHIQWSRFYAFGKPIIDFPMLIFPP